MSTEVHITALVIGIVVAFQCGVYVERGNKPASDIPSNLDAAAAIGEAKACKAEAQACFGLLTEQTKAIIELRNVCASKPESK